MRTDSLFHPIPSEAQASRTVRLTFNDQPLTVAAGSTVAAALLAAGVRRFRGTPVSGAPRAPYCMMGACFECLVNIDGVPNRQACLVDVREGMRIHSQEGARELVPTPVLSPVEVLP